MTSLFFLTATIQNTGFTSDEHRTAELQMKLTVELRMPRDVHVGDAVPMTIRVTNGGRQQVELALQGRSPIFDLVVTGPDGVVWSRLHGASTSAILLVRPLEPGETLELTDRWTQRDDAGRPVPPGIYHVRGIVPGGSEPLRTPVVKLEIRA